MCTRPVGAPPPLGRSPRGAPLPGCLGPLPQTLFGVRAWAGRCSWVGAALRVCGVPRPALFAHSRPAAPGPLPLGSSASARPARPLGPPPRLPPGCSARPLPRRGPFPGSSGRSLAASGSRVARRCAAGFLRCAPVALAALWAPRSPARGPPGPPRRLAAFPARPGGLAGRLRGVPSPPGSAWGPRPGGRPGGSRSGGPRRGPYPAVFSARPPSRFFARPVGAALVVVGPGPVLSCRVCPVGFSLFPPRPLPPLGEGGARGWLWGWSRFVAAGPVLLGWRRGALIKGGGPVPRSDLGKTRQGSLYPARGAFRGYQLRY